MATRPSTARSEISSAISDDGLDSRSQPGENPLSSPTRGGFAPQGYSHVRGAYNSRGARSPPPTVSTASNAPSSRGATPTNSVGARSSHLSNVSQQAFFRPMSSQRLQAQRLRNIPVSAPPPIEDEAEEDDDAASSIKETSTQHVRNDRREAPSVRTDMSEEARRQMGHEARLNYNATPRLPPAFDQSGNSNLGQSGKSLPAPLNLAPQNGQGKYEAAPRSPLSLRSAFSLGSKRYRFQSSHQHLSSTATSPPYDVGMPPNQPVTASKHRNFQYIESNTVFFLGGRLQQSRDRPIVIGTGIAIVLPAILFFIFS